MCHTEVIYLIGVTIIQDAIGNQIETPTEHQVFAEELAVYQNEFYNAALAGLRPEKQFEIWRREYQDEKKLKHNGTVYKIIRTSLGKTTERTRLTCEKVAGVKTDG
jgi:SPP1 family predicted phage head-tail adaptor